MINYTYHDKIVFYKYYQCVHCVYINKLRKYQTIDIVDMHVETLQKTMTRESVCIFTIL